MKLTKTQLKRIIKEELGSLLQEEEKEKWIVVKWARANPKGMPSRERRKGTDVYTSKEEAEEKAKELKGRFDVVKVKDEELNEGWEQALTASEPGVLFAKMREMYEDVFTLLLNMEEAGIEREILEPVGRAVRELVAALKITGGI